MQKVVAMTCDVVEERDLRGLVDGQDEVLVQDDPEISNCGQADSTVQWLEADGQGSVKEAAAFPAAGVTTPCGAPPITQEFLYDAYGVKTYSHETTWAACGIGAVVSCSSCGSGGAAGIGFIRWGFDGQETDPETGLIHEEHRYYNPADGDFISQDPSGLGPDANAYQE